MNELKMAKQFEMTPNKPANDADTIEELILTPSMPEEQSERIDLLLEADSIFKAGEITFDGEEEAENKIAEAMTAYDKAMDEVAGIEQGQTCENEFKTGRIYTAWHSLADIAGVLADSMSVCMWAAVQYL